MIARATNLVGAEDEEDVLREFCIRSRWSNYLASDFVSQPRSCRFAIGVAEGDGRLSAADCPVHGIPVLILGTSASAFNHGSSYGVSCRSSVSVSE